MKARRFATVILLVLAIAAVIVAIRGFTSGDSKSPAPEPSASQTSRGPQRGTDYVEEGIARRLTQVSGRQAKVSCPKLVSANVGTEFTCKVRYAGGDAVVSTAHVKIDGPDGHYSWDATPVDHDNDASNGE